MDKLKAPQSLTLMVSASSLISLTGFNGMQCTETQQASVNIHIKACKPMTELSGTSHLKVFTSSMMPLDGPSYNSLSHAVTGTVVMSFVAMGLSMCLPNQETSRDMSKYSNQKVVPL